MTLERESLRVSPELERVLRERAARLAERTLRVDAPEIHADVIVGVRDAASLGFPIACVQEVRAVRVARWPNAPPHVAGVVSIRGQVFALIEPLRTRPDEKALGHGESTYAVVLAAESGTFAVRLDSVAGARTVYRHELDLGPKDQRNPLFADRTRDGLAIVDVDRLHPLFHPPLHPPFHPRGTRTRGDHT